MNHHSTFPHYWINHLGFVLRAYSADVFARAGLDTSPEEWGVMLILHDEGPMTPSRLAKLTVRDRPATSRLIAKLEGKGLIARAFGETDRRSQVISMTGKGETEFARWRAALMPMIALSQDGISAEEVEATVTVLARMARNLEKDGTT